MKSNTSILRGLGDMLIIGSGYAGDLPAEMISADEIREYFAPEKILWKVLAACAMLPEGSYYDGLNAKIRDLVNEGMVDYKNAKLAKIAGMACNVIVENGEEVEREAMQYIRVATWTDDMMDNYWEGRLLAIARKGNGIPPYFRFCLAVCAYYYYRIAQKKAQK